MENETTLEHKKRLDVEMSDRGLARSRSSAVDLIKRDKVLINGKKASKPSIEVSSKDLITVVDVDKFVSRAGEKLLSALTTFDIDVKDFEVIDIGSSTGGFTQCLLEHGAKKVIALDVGTDQLVSELRNDPRVEVHEGTNVRTFVLPLPVDAAVIDVSFISLELVLPKAFEFLKKGGVAVALVKPQFEVGMEASKKTRGIVTDPNEQKAVLEKVKAAAKKIGFKIVAEIPSPIEGEKGNKEFLLHLRKPRLF